MPLKPDVVIELAAPACPPASELDRLTYQFENLVLPDFGGTNRQILSVCGSRPALNASVITIGIWADASGFTDAQRREELASSNLLTQGRSAGLLVTSDAIRTVVAATWADIPKKVGKARLNDTIDVNVLSDGRIRVRIKGTYKIRFSPNPDFTYTVTDRLSLKPVG